VIRNAIISDSSRIAEIIVNSSRYAYQTFLSEEILYTQLIVEERIEAVKRWIKNNENYIYVYEDDITKIIKGMMGIDKCYDEDKQEAFELHILYVEPEFSRDGIGTKLIEYFENIGKINKKNELVVWVLEENKIGINFYKKKGFIDDGKTKIFERYNKNERRYIKEIQET
jgi:GNAT superfamily N-acetyltransferase